MLKCMTYTAGSPQNLDLCSEDAGMQVEHNTTKTHVNVSTYATHTQCLPMASKAVTDWIWQSHELT